MSGFTIGTQELTQLGGYLDAMESEILATAPKAANKTATWLRKQFSEKVNTLGPKKELVRDMTRIIRAKQGRPIADVRPSGQRLYAASFTALHFQQDGDNPTRSQVQIEGFQETTTAIGFVNSKAKSGNPKLLRTSKTQKNKLQSALGPSPAMLCADFFNLESALDDKINDSLTSSFETELAKAMNNR